MANIWENWGIFPKYNIWAKSLKDKQTLVKGSLGNQREQYSQSQDTKKIKEEKGT